MKTRAVSISCSIFKLRVRRRLKIKSTHRKHRAASRQNPRRGCYSRRSCRCPRRWASSSSCRGWSCWSPCPWGTWSGHPPWSRWCPCRTWKLAQVYPPPRRWDTPSSLQGINVNDINTNVFSFIVIAKITRNWKYYSSFNNYTILKYFYNSILIYTRLKENWA